MRDFSVADELGLPGLRELRVLQAYDELARLEGEGRTDEAADLRSRLRPLGTPPAEEDNS